MATLTALDIARYLLGTLDEDSGEDMTSLKLQKLLYYAQGFYLAMHDCEPLFDDPIEAWQHGPVVPAVYQVFKDNGRSPIARPAPFDPQDYAPEVREILDTVSRVYGQFAPWKLRDMTHQEPPWRDTPQNQAIPRESLREFFARLVEAGRNNQGLESEPVWPTNSFLYQRRRQIMKSATKRDRIPAILARIPSPDPWAVDRED
jgi:uncharacterized phage-associated protein